MIFVDWKTVKNKAATAGLFRFYLFMEMGLVENQDFGMIVVISIIAVIIALLTVIIVAKKNRKKKMDQYARTACIADCPSCKNHCGSYRG